MPAQDYLEVRFWKLHCLAAAYSNRLAHMSRMLPPYPTLLLGAACVRYMTALAALTAQCTTPFELPALALLPPFLSAAVLPRPQEVLSSNKTTPLSS